MDRSRNRSGFMVNSGIIGENNGTVSLLFLSPLFNKNLEL